jgi:HlyD family secretion protein
MDVPTSDKQIRSTSEAPSAAGAKQPRAATRTPALIVGVIAALVIGLSLFYQRWRGQDNWMRG